MEPKFRITRWFLSKKNRIYIIITGLVAFTWFLIRVIPKPERASYPCQRAAFPIASGFIIWISINIATFLGLRQLRAIYHNARSRYVLTAIVLLAIFYSAWFAFVPVTSLFAEDKVDQTELFVPNDSVNNPMGTGRGIIPGRVVWAFDTTFTKWNKKGYWWDSLYTDQAVVSDMVARSIGAVAGSESDSSAWDAIFKYFNIRHGRGNTGYTKGEKIAIKLSLVQCTDPNNAGDNRNFTPPQTVLALLRQLVYVAGVDPADITFFDIMRAVPASITKRCKQEFPTVNFVGASTKYYQTRYVRDTVTIHWSKKLDKEIGGGNKAYLPTVITNATYLINLANLKGHHMTGVTTCSKNHFGSMSSDGDVNTPKAIGLHPYVIVHDYKIPGSAEWSFTGNPMGSYNALVDLMGHKEVGEKTLLFIIDGLFSTPREDVSNSSAIRWKQPPFNDHFSSSIFMSLDNVAIESVAIDFLRTEQEINTSITQKFDDGTGYHNVIFGSVDNYLHEAALADSSPSGIQYTPNGDGIKLKSLGVHEHWNNSIDKQYSRNLGKNYGIELYKVSPEVAAPVLISAAFNEDNFIKLAWEKSHTKGYMQIYRSINSATNFKLIANVTIDENSFTDTSLIMNASHYYRIKIKDSSAYSGFSNEVTVTPATNSFAAFVNTTLSVYPNPVSESTVLKFTNPSMGYLNIKINDLSGRMIKNYSLHKNNIEIEQTINLSDLNSGLYKVVITFKNIQYQKSVWVN